MSRTPAASFHYAGLTKEAVENTFVAASKFIKYSDFKGNKKIETVEDKGHTGSRGIDTNIIRTLAYAEPQIDDALRPDGGLEELLHAFFGSVNTTHPGTTAYLHAFTPGDALPTYSLTHGFNYSTEVAWGYSGATCDSLEFALPTDDLPSVSAKWISNFPTAGVVEPTLTFATTPPFKPTQLKAYMCAPNGTPAGGDVISGFQEAKVTLSNNQEKGFSAGDTYGLITKDLGAMTVEGSFTKRYTGDFQREWATLTSNGTAVSQESFSKLLRFEYIGSIIESTYPYKFVLDLPAVEIIDVVPVEAGEGAKTMEVKFQGMAGSTLQKAIASVQSKVVSL